MFKAAVKARDRCGTVSIRMRPVHIIGVSLDLGGNRRGVDMGPSAFRIAGLGERLAALGMTVVDEGDLVAPIPETKSFGDPGKKYIREIARVCEKLLQDVARGARERGIPARARRRSQPRGRIGRGDGRVRAARRQTARADLGRRARRHEHAVELRQRQRARHAARVAARSRAGRAVAHRRVHAQGAPRAHRPHRHPQSRRAREGDRPRLGRARLHDEGHRSRRHRRRSPNRRWRLPATGTGGVHVSFDLDVCDPTIAPGVGTP